MKRPTFPDGPGRHRAPYELVTDLSKSRGPFRPAMHRADDNVRALRPRDAFSDDPDRTVRGFGDAA